MGETRKKQHSSIIGKTVAFDTVLSVAFTEKEAKTLDLIAHKIAYRHNQLLFA